MQLQQLEVLESRLGRVDFEHLLSINVSDCPTCGKLSRNEITDQLQLTQKYKNPIQPVSINLSLLSIDSTWSFLHSAIRLFTLHHISLIWFVDPLWPHSRCPYFCQPSSNTRSGVQC